MIRAPDFGPRGQRFELCWRLNSGHGRMALYCTEIFIITLPQSAYNLHNVERDVRQPLIIRSFLKNGIRLNFE